MGEVLVLGKQKMEDAPLLLDTCAAIWLADNQRVSEGTLKAVQRAGEVGESIYVSPITAWELGLLVSLERLILFMPPVRWFDRLIPLPYRPESESGSSIPSTRERLALAT
jgi:hypothetical protein